MSGSVPCPSCGLPVPPGRLACPACGTLVASVAHAVPAPAAAPTSSEPPDLDPASTPESSAAAWPDPAPEPEPEAEAPTETVTAVAQAAEAAPAEKVSMALPEPDPEKEPVPEPDTDLAAATLAGDGVASGGIVPGSYLPPSTVHRPSAPVSDGPSWPSGPPTLPAEWAPRPASSAPEPAPWAPTPGAVGGLPLTTAAPVAAAPVATGRVAETGGREPFPGRASILADLPFDAPDEIEGWLVTLGAGVGMLAFFLPWRDSLGEGLDGYFGSWGLGIATHLPMFVLVLVVLALAVLPTRVAPWVRTGVLGMVIGGILFGLVWLYLEGGASQLGALLGAVGAVLMISGGVIAVAPGRAKRHDTDA